MTAEIPSPIGHAITECLDATGARLASSPRGRYSPGRTLAGPLRQSRSTGQRVLHALRFFLAALCLTAVCAIAAADSGLPLPRFVSLKAGEVNARAGPGFRYPVSWVFLRKDMPVEVVEEFGQWRRVRDIEDAGGWVHQRLLSGRRGVMVAGEEHDLYREPDTSALLAARAEAGVQGRLLSCSGAWCQVDLAGHRGWMPRAHLWGVYDGETVE